MLKMVSLLTLDIYNIINYSKSILMHNPCTVINLYYRFPASSGINENTVATIKLPVSHFRDR